MVNEISCQDVAKIYDNGKEALSAVSFTIPTRGIFALIGRNGAGKTTLTRILSTLLEPSTGKATIDGLDVMACSHQPFVRWDERWPPRYSR